MAIAIAQVVEATIGTFAPELLVLSVFLVSYTIWRHLGQHSKRMRAEKKVFLLEGDKSASPQIHNHTSKIDDKWEAARQAASDNAVKAVEAQMLQHLEQREFTRALNLYRSLERDGRERAFSEELYAAFIQSSVRVGKVDVVERLLRAMKKSKLMPSLNFWQVMLKMLSSRKHFSTCLSVHSLFARELPIDKVVFSCFINAALEVGSPEDASVMLGRYSEADLEPKDHVLFFRTYVALKDVDAAEAIFRKLGSQMTTLMLNLLLLTCVNAGQIQRAQDFLQEAYTLQKDNETDTAIVDVVSYNTVIKGLTRAGSRPQSFNCLHEMIERAIEPDDITLGILLDASIMDNDSIAANEIVNLVMSSDRQLDTVMCTLFIKGLVRANCLSKALELCEDMKNRQGARPDLITYSVLIKALVDQKDLDRALILVEDMKAAGHTPDDIILTHLLEGCRHVGNHTLGKKLFTEMLSSGLKPSEFTLVTMLKLHGRCGAHKEAHDLVAGWEGAHGDKPSVIHYTCLMSGCLRTRNYDLAWSAYELMRAGGVQPDGTTLSTLLPGMVADRQWDRVISLARLALTLPQQYRVPAETLNNALSQMQVAGGRGKSVEQLRELMGAAGITAVVRQARR